MQDDGLPPPPPPPAPPPPEKPTGVDWEAMGKGCQSLGCLLTLLGFGLLGVIFLVSLAAGGR